MKFHKFINDILKKFNLSKAQFAREIGVSAAAVCKWSYDEYIPSLPVLRKIEGFCSRYDVTFSINDIET